MTKRIIQFLLMAAAIGLWLWLANSPWSHVLAKICSIGLLVTIPVLGICLIFGAAYWLIGYDRTSEFYLAASRHLIGIILSAVPILIVTNCTGGFRWLWALIILGAGFHQRRESWESLVICWRGITSDANRV